MIGRYRNSAFGEFPIDDTEIEGMMPGELVARSIASGWLAECSDRVSGEIFELVVSAVHDGMDAGSNGISVTASRPATTDEKLAHYALGYVHGHSDGNSGPIEFA